MLLPRRKFADFSAHLLSRHLSASLHVLEYRLGPFLLKHERQIPQRHVPLAPGLHEHDAVEVELGLHGLILGKRGIRRGQHRRWTDRVTLVVDVHV